MYTFCLITRTGESGIAVRRRSLKRRLLPQIPRNKNSTRYSPSIIPLALRTCSSLEPKCYVHLLCPLKRAIVAENSPTFSKSNKTIPPPPSSLISLNVASSPLQEIIFLSMTSTKSHSITEVRSMTKGTSESIGTIFTATCIASDTRANGGFVEIRV